MSRLELLYDTALAAVDRAVVDPETRAAITERAVTGAVRLGLEPKGDFLSTALTLSLLYKGKVLWLINKNLMDPRIRNRIADFVADALRGLAGIPKTGPSAAATEFTDQGIAPLPDLVTARQAQEMFAHFKTRTNLRRDETVLHYDIHDVVAAPHAFRIATDERVLAIAEHHLGAPPIAVQVDTWWSLAEGPEPIGAQIFHRDRDDFRACKLFLYLSDVGEDEGPHIFVRRSHRWDLVKQTLGRQGVPVETLGLFFGGNGRQVAGNIDRFFKDDIDEITGPAGTCFLENTYGFHRGKVPTAGARCIFQVSYGMIPFPDRVGRWVGADLPELPPGCGTSPRARWAMNFALRDTWPAIPAAEAAET